MFAPEIADGTVKVMLQDWELPRIDLWTVFPAGRTATAKARIFTQFVDQPFNFGLGKVLSAAELTVRPAHWGNCSFFGGWCD